jgi:hypothetical protein
VASRVVLSSIELVSCVRVSLIQLADSFKRRTHPHTLNMPDNGLFTVYIYSSSVAVQITIFLCSIPVYSCLILKFAMIKVYAPLPLSAYFPMQPLKIIYML